MMNKLKYLFLLALCVAAIGGLTNVSAQMGGDKVLVAGKKPLKQSEVDKLVEFYEWAFEAELTGEQREKLQSYTEASFRRNAATARKDIDSVLSGFVQVKATEQSVQQQTRETFLSEFLGDLRKANDEESQFIVSIYDNAHGGSDSNAVQNTVNQTSEESQVGDNSSAGVGSVSALVGKWVWGRSGSSTYATGGAYMGSNGSRHTYQFSSNGAVEYTGIMNVMTGGCNMQIFKTMKGRASLSGDTLTINWSPASFSRDDSCSPSKNYKKTLPAETETFNVNFKDSYGQRQLCLTSKDETCFSPTK